MIEEAIWLDRDNTRELITFLNGADGEAVRQKLVLSLRRKLGDPVPEQTEGEDGIDRLERFFDVALADVEPYHGER